MKRILCLLALVVLCCPPVFAGESEAGAAAVGETGAAAAASPSKEIAPTAPADAAAEGAEAVAAGENSEPAPEDPLAKLTWYDGTVTRVRDADFVEIDGEKMRLLGVAASRRWWWGTARDCYANESAGFLEGRVLNQPVQYAFDPRVGPDSKRGLRWIYLVLDGKLLNEEVVANGQGLVDRSRVYLAKERLLDAEDEAKLRFVGIWHVCPVECFRDRICRMKDW